MLLIMLELFTCVWRDFPPPYRWEFCYITILKITLRHFHQHYYPLLFIIIIIYFFFMWVSIPTIEILAKTTTQVPFCLIHIHYFSQVHHLGLWIKRVSPLFELTILFVELCHLLDFHFLCQRSPIRPGPPSLLCRRLASHVCLTGPVLLVIFWCLGPNHQSAIRHGVTCCRGKQWNRGYAWRRLRRDAWRLPTAAPCPSYPAAAQSAPTAASSLPTATTSTVPTTGRWQNWKHKAQDPVIGNWQIAQHQFTGQWVQSKSAELFF